MQQTEVILSRYASHEAARGLDPTISSTKAVSNKKELKILYGDGDDVFTPRIAKVKAGELLEKINQEQQSMLTKRPFQRLEAPMSEHSSNLMAKMSTRRPRN